jgi:hypothetical protein
MEQRSLLEAHRNGAPEISFVRSASEQAMAVIDGLTNPSPSRLALTRRLRILGAERGSTETLKVARR